MLQMEREVIQAALCGRESIQPVVEHADLEAYPILADNPQRQQVIRGILATRDQTVILQGSAGTGKSASLRILSEISQQHGYEIVGLAPTGRAADNLSEIGVKAETLQKFLTRREERSSSDPGYQPRFYLLDETSLASTAQMHKFYQRIQPDDRVLLIGDDSPKRAVGQHTSVEAGRILQELQEAGVKTAELNRILRQKEPWLLNVVQQLRGGHLKEAVEALDKEGKVEEYATRELRFARIARMYTQQPERTMIIAPDNATKWNIVDVLKNELRAKELVADEKEATVYVSRDLTRADRTLAQNYKVFDSIRYLSGSAEHSIKANDYATVLAVDRTRNLLTVVTADQRRITYDPRQALANASVYEKQQIALGVGDRIQFTAPFKQKKVRTRETGTVKEFDGKEILVALDNGKRVRWSLQQFRHIDFGYVMTSHASQSSTVDRSLVYVETDDTKELVKSLSRLQEKHKALSSEQIKELAKTA